MTQQAERLVSPPGDDARGQPCVVLVIEHDAAVAELARRYLERDGLTVRVAGTPADAAAALRASPPAVVVLDLTMPGLTPGIVCRRIPMRGHGAGFELICVEGPGGLRPRHIGISGEGDRRCLARPFSPRVLVARVRAALCQLAAIRQSTAATGQPDRKGQAATPMNQAAAAMGQCAATTGQAAAAMRRSPAATAHPRTGWGAADAAGVVAGAAGVEVGTYTLGELILDSGSRRASVAGVHVHLTATEFALLAFLAHNAGRVFSRQQLLGAVRGAGATAGARSVDVHVLQLRAKLGTHSPIRTVRGVGYVAEAPTEPCSDRLVTKLPGG
jgi:DNA-binding response OmpR family regulator